MPIYEVTKIFKEDLKRFSGYKRTFFCPECKTAPLVYVDGATPYFRTWSQVKHAPDCPLQQDVMSAKQVDAYMREPENRDKIVRELRKLFLLLFDDDKEKRSEETPFSKFSFGEKRKNRKEVEKSYKRLPQKRIDVTLHDSDFMCYKMFYGNVNLLWEKYSGGYKLVLRSMSSHSFICRIYITNIVYSYIDGKLKDSNSYGGRIVFFAKLGKDKCGYNMTRLESSEFLYIEPL